MFSSKNIYLFYILPISSKPHLLLQTEASYLAIVLITGFYSPLNCSTLLWKAALCCKQPPYGTVTHSTAANDQSGMLNSPAHSRTKAQQRMIYSLVLVWLLLILKQFLLRCTSHCTYTLFHPSVYYPWPLSLHISFVIVADQCLGMNKIHKERLQVFIPHGKCIYLNVMSNNVEQWVNVVWHKMYPCWMDCFFYL